MHLSSNGHHDEVASKGVTKSVDEAMSVLGLDGPFPQQQYVEHMETVFGSDGVRFLDAVDEWISAGSHSIGAASLYRMKSRRPQMAAYVSRHQYSGLYRAVACELNSWGGLKDHTVVDIGCGFGLLTSLLAELHPASKFIGLDHAHIVAAAREINSDTRTTNVEFRSELRPLSSANRVVLMTCVTHEAFPSMQLDFASCSREEKTLLRTIRKAVGEHGLLVTINRFLQPEMQVSKLDALLTSSGLEASETELSDAIVIHQAGQQMAMSVRAYQPTVGS